MAIEPESHYDAQHTQFEANYGAAVGHWREHPISPLIPNLVSAHRSMVDIGCGAGEKTIEIARMHPDLTIVGIDSSEKAIEAARHNLIEAPDVEGRIQFIEADVLKGLPFPNGGVEVFHDYLCFTHIHQDDWPTYFGEAARVATHGGLIVTFTREDKDFYGYNPRALENGWVVFKNDHDGTPRPQQAINDGYGYHFARAHELYEAVQPWFNVTRLELREHPHPDHKGKRYLWHFQVEARQ